MAFTFQQFNPFMAFNPFMNRIPMPQMFPQQSPQILNPTNNKVLYVGNLPVETSDFEIKNLFGAFGEIEDVRLVRLKHCCFIKYYNANCATLALQKTGNGVFLRGQMLKVNWGKEPAPGFVNNQFTDRNQPPSRHIWVGNISSSMNEQSLYDYFVPYGEIESIKIYPNKQCGFICYKTVGEAEKAIKCMDNRRVIDSVIRVNFGKDMPQLGDHIFYPASPSGIPGILNSELVSDLTLLEDGVSRLLSVYDAQTRKLTVPFSELSIFLLPAPAFPPPNLFSLSFVHACASLFVDFESGGSNSSSGNTAMTVEGGGGSGGMGADGGGGSGSGRIGCDKCDGKDVEVDGKRVMLRSPYARFLLKTPEGNVLNLQSMAAQRRYYLFVLFLRTHLGINAAHYNKKSPSQSQSNNNSNSNRNSGNIQVSGGSNVEITTATTNSSSSSNGFSGCIVGDNNSDSVSSERGSIGKEEANDSSISSNSSGDNNNNSGSDGGSEKEEEEEEESNTVVQRELLLFNHRFLFPPPPLSAASLSFSSSSSSSTSPSTSSSSSSSSSSSTIFIPTPLSSAEVVCFWYALKKIVVEEDSDAEMAKVEAERKKERKGEGKEPMIKKEGGKWENEGVKEEDEKEGKNENDERRKKEDEEEEEGKKEGDGFKGEEDTLMKEEEDDGNNNKENKEKQGQQKKEEEKDKEKEESKQETQTQQQKQQQQQQQTHHPKWSVTGRLEQEILRLVESIDLKVGKKGKVKVKEESGEEEEEEKWIGKTEGGEEERDGEGEGNDGCVLVGYLEALCSLIINGGINNYYSTTTKATSFSSSFSPASSPSPSHPTSTPTPTPTSASSHTSPFYSSSPSPSESLPSSYSSSSLASPSDGGSTSEVVFPHHLLFYTEFAFALVSSFFRKYIAANDESTSSSSSSSPSSSLSSSYSYASTPSSSFTPTTTTHTSPISAPPPLPLPPPPHPIWDTHISPLLLWLAQLSYFDAFTYEPAHITADPVAPPLPAPQTNSPFVPLSLSLLGGGGGGGLGLGFGGGDSGGGGYYPGITSSSLSSCFRTPYEDSFARQCRMRLANAVAMLGNTASYNDGASSSAFPSSSSTSTAGASSLPRSHPLLLRLSTATDKLSHDLDAAMTACTGLAAPGGNTYERARQRWLEEEVAPRLVARGFACAAGAGGSGGSAEEGSIAAATPGDSVVVASTVSTTATSTAADSVVSTTVHSILPSTIAAGAAATVSAHALAKEGETAAAVVKNVSSDSTSEREIRKDGEENKDGIDIIDGEGSGGGEIDEDANGGKKKRKRGMRFRDGSGGSEERVEDSSGDGGSFGIKREKLNNEYENDE